MTVIAVAVGLDFICLSRWCRDVFTFMRDKLHYMRSPKL